MPNAFGIGLLAYMPDVKTTWHCQPKFHLVKVQAE